ncbi:MAG: universal stress protein [Actinomycetota bacterium]|nr:universal stress protein [Actinomycetota bacterium]
MMAFFPTRVLLATDGSPDAALATQSAIELCEKTGSELHVAHVGEYLSTFYAYTEEEPAELRDNAQRLLDEEVERIRAEGGRIAEDHLRLGRPAEQIVTLSEELGVGIIVVGSRGLGALRRAVLGSVSESVVRHAHCPVFVVRADERTSPS